MALLSTRSSTSVSGRDTLLGRDLLVLVLWRRCPLEGVEKGVGVLRPELVLGADENYPEDQDSRPQEAKSSHPFGRLDEVLLAGHGPQAGRLLLDHLAFDLLEKQITQEILADLECCPGQSRGQDDLPGCEDGTVFPLTHSPKNPDLPELGRQDGVFTGVDHPVRWQPDRIGLFLVASLDLFPPLRRVVGIGRDGEGDEHQDKQGATVTHTEILFSRSQGNRPATSSVNRASHTNNFASPEVVPRTAADPQLLDI